MPSDHNYNTRISNSCMAFAFLVIIIGSILILVDPTPTLDQTICYRQSCECQEFYRDGNETCLKSDVTLLHLKEDDSSYKQENLLDFPICPPESGVCWVNLKEDEVFFAPPELSVVQVVGKIFLEMGGALMWPILIIQCIHLD